MAKRKNITTTQLALMTAAAVISLRGLPMMAQEELTMFFYIFFATFLFLIPAALVGAELGSAFADRGGDIPFHGPGQLVCYPILDLERIGIGLREYIEALEEAVIRTVAEYGIAAGRIAGASGAWIDPGKARPRKICAIGVRSSRYVTMHGFALNVTTDLEWFSRINPCGFTDRGVTSIAAETGSQPSMQEVKQLVIRELATALQCEITSGS